MLPVQPGWLPCKARKEGREAAPTHPSKAAQKDSESKSSSDEKAPVAPGASVAIQATEGTGYGKDGGTSVKDPVNGTAKETAAQAVGKAIDKTAIVGTVDMGFKGAADKTVNGAAVVDDGHMSVQVSDDHSDNEAIDQAAASEKEDVVMGSADAGLAGEGCYRH